MQQYKGKNSECGWFEQIFVNNAVYEPNVYSIYEKYKNIYILFKACDNEKYGVCTKADYEDSMNKLRTLRCERDNQDLLLKRYENDNMINESLIKNYSQKMMIL